MHGRDADSRRVPTLFDFSGVLRRVFTLLFIKPYRLLAEIHYIHTPNKFPYSRGGINIFLLDIRNMMHDVVIIAQSIAPKCRNSPLAVEGFVIVHRLRNAVRIKRNNNNKRIVTQKGNAKVKR